LRYEAAAKAGTGTKTTQADHPSSKKTSAPPVVMEPRAPSIGFQYEKEGGLTENQLETTLTNPHGDLIKLEVHLDEHRVDYQIQNIGHVQIQPQSDYSLEVQLKMSEDKSTRFYASHDTKSMRFQTLKKASMAEVQHSLPTICRANVDLAENGAEFDLSDTPKEKQAAVYAALSEAIEAAVREKRFTEKTKPHIVGYTPPTPAKPTLK
jgi:hypothetical protein